MGETESWQRGAWKGGRRINHSHKVKLKKKERKKMTSMGSCVEFLLDMEENSDSIRRI